MEHLKRASQQIKLVIVKINQAPKKEYVLNFSIW